MSGRVSGAPKAPKAIIEQVDPAAGGERSDGGEGAPTGRSESASQSSGRFQDATMGFFKGVGRSAWTYADAHPHATLYGIIGFVLALLILFIGLWDTIVIAVFSGIGVVIGQMVDNGDGTVRLFGRRVGKRR